MLGVWLRTGLTNRCGVELGGFFNSVTEFTPEFTRRLFKYLTRRALIQTNLSWLVFFFFIPLLHPVLLTKVTKRADAITVFIVQQCR